MEITQKKVGRACVVTPQVKKIDASVAVEFRNQLLDLVATGEHRLVLNLGGVDFIDSSGLGFLISLKKVTQDEGVSMSISNLPEKPRRTFEIARVDKILLHA